MFDKFTTTGIGSMPHTDASRACDIILEKIDIPFWPQLPQRSFKELMIPQYSEGFPMVKMDLTEQKIWIDERETAELNDFYESYNDETSIEISEDYARGFYAFINKIKGRTYPCLKGQVTGPLTFSLGLKDKEGTPIFFNEELREISLMVLKGKIKWQVKRLMEFADNVLIFIDEPILSAIGTSSYMGVSEEETKRLLSEIVASIRQEGGVSAIHCCGKADWQMVEESGIDVVNFDAYDYFENFSIYTDSLAAFLKRGGHIAWGIVPTNEGIQEATLEILKEKFMDQITRLSKKLGWDDLASNVLLTPSCGAGSLKESEAEKVFDLLDNLKKSLLSGEK